MDTQENEPMTPEMAVMVLKGTGNSLGMQGEAVAALAKLVESAMPSPWMDARDSQGRPRAWHFVGYRDSSPEGNRDNPPEQAQYQGVMFADGTVAMRWLTPTRSVSVWDCFGDAFDAHGRPEYGTRIVWTGEAPAEALEVIAAAEEELAAKEAALEHVDDPEFRATVAEGHAELDALKSAYASEIGFASIAEAQEAGALDFLVGPARNVELHPDDRDDR